MQKWSYDSECKEEYRCHHRDKHRYGRVLARQYVVGVTASYMFLTLFRPCDASVADFIYERVTHVSHRRASVESALVFHLKNDVLQHLLLVLIKTQLLKYELIAFDQLCRCKSKRYAGSLRMVLNEMDDCMNAAVHGSSIVGAVAEVLP